jgi:hypothetical protein
MMTHSRKRPCLRVTSTSTAAAVLIALSAFAGHAQAQSVEMTSIYTSTAPKDCQAAKRQSKNAPEEGAERWCKGVGEFSVLVQEDDLRETISIGRNAAAAKAEPAAQNWFGPFSSTTQTIEWRGPKDGAPVAIIQRWHLADNEDVGKDNRPISKQVLVVTRLPPGKVCHVAYIDVKANPDANTVAREAAEKAKGFNCEKDKVFVHGNPGRGTALAMP